MGGSASKEDPPLPPPPSPPPVLGKSGKKICCSCPETKAARDQCIVDKGPENLACEPLIEAHKKCLRAEGFNV